jgi:hypothetical protein
MWLNLEVLLLESVDSVLVFSKDRASYVLAMGTS